MENQLDYDGLVQWVSILCRNCAIDILAKCKKNFILVSLNRPNSIKSITPMSSSLSKVSFCTSIFCSLTEMCKCLNQFRSNMIERGFRSFRGVTTRTNCPRTSQDKSIGCVSLCLFGLPYCQYEIRGAFSSKWGEFLKLLLAVDTYEGL